MATISRNATCCLCAYGGGLTKSDLLQKLVCALNMGKCVLSFIASLSCYFPQSLLKPNSLCLVRPMPRIHSSFVQYHVSGICPILMCARKSIAEHCKLSHILLREKA